MAKAVLHWTLVLLAFVFTVVVAFLPVMFGLLEILPHKSSDLPDAMLFWSTVLVSVILAVVAGRLVHRLLQRRASLRGSGAGA
jgi:undecaprenyl pyrophosphate phosphatase UppP